MGQGDGLSSAVECQLKQDPELQELAVDVMELQDWAVEAGGNPEAVVNTMLVIGHINDRFRRRLRRVAPSVASREALQLIVCETVSIKAKRQCVNAIQRT